MNETCSNCRHMQALIAEVGTVTFNTCHRFPPNVFIFPGQLETILFESQWPKVALNDWCAEFQKKTP